MVNDWLKQTWLDTSLSCARGEGVLFIYGSHLYIVSMFFNHFAQPHTQWKSDCSVGSPMSYHLQWRNVWQRNLCYTSIFSGKYISSSSSVMPVWLIMMELDDLHDTTPFTCQLPVKLSYEVHALHSQYSAWTWHPMSQAHLKLYVCTYMFLDFIC